MHTLAKTLLSSTLALMCAAPALAAPTPTVTCTNSTDGVTFTANVLQLYVDTSKDLSSFYFAIHTDIAKYNEALDDEYFISDPFDACTFSGTGGSTPENLTITDVVGATTPQGNYALITFTFKALMVGPAASARRMFASNAPLTKQEKAAEAAAFKASIPPLAVAKETAVKE